MRLISKALRSLYPNSQYTIENEDINKIYWISNPPETLASIEELHAEVARLEALELSNAYQRARKIEYPAIAEQLDMLWHAIDSGSLDKDSNFYTTLKAVKDANPKG
jgi:hypothetical protein